MSNERQYLDLLGSLIHQPDRNDRTGVGTHSRFGVTLDLNLTNNTIPLITTRKINPMHGIKELYWMFVLGNKDTSYLDDEGIPIWREWYVPTSDGKYTIGKMYGQVLGDQLVDAINLLRERPQSRRALFSTYDPSAVALESLSFADNVAEGRGVLNPCHGLMNQLYINDAGRLEMFTFQRSADICLGVPTNLVFYSVLAHVIAQCLNTTAQRLVYSFGDVHLYSNHIDGATEQVSRVPYGSARIELDPSIKDWSDYHPDKVQVIGYKHHPTIKYQVAV